MSADRGDPAKRNEIVASRKIGLPDPPPPLFVARLTLVLLVWVVTAVVLPKGGYGKDRKSGEQDMGTI